jgi:transaldolase
MQNDSLHTGTNKIGTNKLEQLATVTEIVADTGDLAAIQRFQPSDATTNPSLLLKLAQGENGDQLLSDAFHLARALQREPSISLLCDAFATLTGARISQLITGLVSTEVDARLSFDTPAMLARSRRLHLLYRELGIDSDRILIKLAATWQGMCAADVLEQEGIQCNMTLLFNLSQARAAADAGVTLISPFVGRIYDWYVKQGHNITCAEDDPGVQSVRSIHHYYKTHGIDTIIMGASFRNTGQIEALAGCEKLTISPALLDQLSADNGALPVALPQNLIMEAESPPLSESQFLLQMTEDAMATELLADGIRRFIADQQTLEACFSRHLPGATSGTTESGATDDAQDPRQNIAQQHSQDANARTA